MCDDLGYFYIIKAVLAKWACINHSSVGDCDEKIIFDA